MAFSLLSGTSGIQPGFLSSLEALRRAMPNNLGAQIGIKSGYRSPERQRFLFDRAVRKYGSVAAARKWVAPPGRSQHNLGNAVDLHYGSPAAMRAAHQLAGQFGLHFPMSYENWHIEPIGARGGKSTPARTAAEAGAGLVTDSTGPGLASAFTGVSSGGGVGGGAGGDKGGGLPKISAGGPPRGAGLIYGDTPQIDTSLETTPVTPSPETYATPEGVPMESLASLFKLPTIAGSDPLLDADAPPGLPGQAKPLTRKVWR
jgi:D-alanyl-D-alanine carboxypeptidase